MPDIMAIVSKGVFEKDAKQNGKLVALGEVWKVDRYNSTNKALSVVDGGGRIFLVTVRPPDEQLWLVALIDSPKFDGAAWVSKTANTTPVTNISALRKTIVFESGKGMSQDKGALGMSLQTPRTLTASDVSQLLAAAGSVPAIAAPPSADAPPRTGPQSLLAEIAASPKDEMLRERVLRRLLADGAMTEAEEALRGIAHLDAHDPSGLPCLCKECWKNSGTTHEAGGVVFARDLVIKNNRVLFYWAPAELEARATALRNSVRASLVRRLADLARSRKRQVRPAF